MNEGLISGRIKSVLRRIIWSKFRNNRLVWRLNEDGFLTALRMQVSSSSIEYGGRKAR